MRKTVFLCLLAVGIFGCDDDGSTGLGAFTAGPGIVIDNQGVISVNFGSEAGEVAAGDDPRFGQSSLDDAIQAFLDANGYTPGAAYGDTDVQEYLDAGGYVTGPHVASLEGLGGGTVTGNVVIDGDLTVTGTADLNGQGLTHRRVTDSWAAEIETNSVTAQLMHTFTFTTRADPLATGFVVELEILREASGSGGASARFELEDWSIGSASLSWGMGTEDPADTWIPKRFTYVQNLPLIGTDHDIEMYMAYSWGGAAGPKVKVRNITMSWFVVD